MSMPLFEENSNTQGVAVQTRQQVIKYYPSKLPLVEMQNHSYK